MRWDLLFDDLASQLEHEQRAEDRVLELEEERLRLSRLSLRDRLQAMSRAAAPGTGIRIQLRGGAIVVVRAGAFGRDWMSGDLIERAPARGCVVPMSAIAAVVPERMPVAAARRASSPDGSGSGAGAGAPAGVRAEPTSGAAEAAGESSPGLADRITLAFVLRDLCRRRTPVTVATEDGDLHGTLDRIGRDHLDLALHEPGIARRDEELQGYRIVPLDRVRLITFR